MRPALTRLHTAAAPERNLSLSSAATHLPRSCGAPAEFQVAVLLVPAEEPAALHARGTPMAHIPSLVMPFASSPAASAAHTAGSATAGGADADPAAAAARTAAEATARLQRAARAGLATQGLARCGLRMSGPSHLTGGWQRLRLRLDPPAGVEVSHVVVALRGRACRCVGRKHGEAVCARVCVCGGPPIPAVDVGGGWAQQQRGTCRLCLLGIYLFHNPR